MWLLPPQCLYPDFLSSGSCRFPDLTQRPLQFVLMDSMQKNVQDVTGSTGRLYCRDDLGVPCAIAVPKPSLQLLAGMLSQYHPDMYPEVLLRAVATNGRYLDRYTVRPFTELVELKLQHLKIRSLLQGNHLAAIERAIQMHGTVKLLQVEDLAALSQLWSYEVFEASPMDNRSLQLVEPQLLTITHLAKAGANKTNQMNEADETKLMEEALSVAEGYVLEVLLRTDLINSLLQRLELAGEAQLHDAHQLQECCNCHHCRDLQGCVASLRRQANTVVG